MIYYSENVTLLVGDFDIRYYDEVNVSITPTTRKKEYSYNVLLCQVACDEDNISTTLAINFPGRIDAVNGHQTKDYVRFPGFQYPTIPGLFVLVRSNICFSFTHVGGTLFPNSTVNLFVFTNVDECTDFINGVINPSPPPTKSLTQQEGFTYNFTTTADNYICIIVEIPENTIFNYTAYGTVVQYQTLSYLAGKSLCETNNSLILETTGDSIRRDLSLKLSRPLGRTSALTTQPTCVLLVVSDINSRAYNTFETTATIFRTNTNVGVISLSAFAFIFLSVAVTFILICVYVSLC